MQVATFAAIDIGSYDVTLEIFEISKKTGIHSIDTIRHRDVYKRQPFIFCRSGGRRPSAFRPRSEFIWPPERYRQIILKNFTGSSRRRRTTWIPHVRRQSIFPGH